MTAPPEHDEERARREFRPVHDEERARREFKLLTAVQARRKARDRLDTWIREHADRDDCRIVPFGERRHG
jgi:hypothetical protein